MNDMSPAGRAIFEALAPRKRGDYSADVAAGSPDPLDEWCAAETDCAKLREQNRELAEALRLIGPLAHTPDGSKSGMDRALNDIADIVGAALAKVAP